MRWRDVTARRAPLGTRRNGGGITRPAARASARAFRRWHALPRAMGQHSNWPYYRTGRASAHGFGVEWDFADGCLTRLDGLRGRGGVGGGVVQLAETALALTVGIEGRQEIVFAEIGPEDRGGVIFRVSRLPDEVIAEPHLARRADDEIGVGQVAGVERAGDHVFGDGVGGRAIGHDRAHGVDNFGASAIVEADVEAE